MSIKKLLPLLLVIGSGLWGVKALIHPGFYTSHDGWHNVARLYHYHQALSDGQIPPRWISSLAHGFGYPLFLFSYHAPWIIAEPFLQLGVGIIDGVKIVLLLGYLLSGIFMFLWVRDMWGTRAGVVAGIIFLWTPYRFAKIFVGASVGEATIFMFIPLFFWALYRLSRTPHLFWHGIGIVGFSGIALSHLMLLPLLSPFILSYLAMLFIATKNRRQFLRHVCVMLFGGIGLSSFYVLPAFFYRLDITASYMGGGFANLYENHLLYVSQLIYSKWGFGPVVTKATESELSFQVGIAQWIAAFGALIMLGYLVIKKFLQHKYQPSFSRKDIVFILWCLSSFVVAVIAMTTISFPFWKWTSRYVTLDFPWRLLTITTLTGAVMTGWLVRISGRFGTVMALGIILIALYTNRNHIRVNQYTDVPLSLYIASETTTNTYAEYLPKWATIDINQENLPLFVPNADIELLKEERDTKEIRLHTRSHVPAQITLNYLYFPGQTVYLNGKKSEFSFGDGRIVFSLPQGENQVRVAFEPTSIMRLGDSITLVTLFTFLLLSLRRSKSQPTPTSKIKIDASRKTK